MNSLLVDHNFQTRIAGCFSVRTSDTGDILDNLKEKVTVRRGLPRLMPQSEATV